MFATAGEDGRVLVFDMRAGGTERVALAKHRAPFHAIQYHPLDGHFLITANGKDGAAFWDLRQTRAYVYCLFCDIEIKLCISDTNTTVPRFGMAVKMHLTVV